MYQTKKIFIKPHMKMADLIFENPSLLLMMEHFDLDIVVRNKTVEQIYRDNGINSHVFISIANLYNGFYPSNIISFNTTDIEPIIRFLGNSHRYYLEEKIPDIHCYIRKWLSKNSTPEIKLIERFFDEYSGEVKEHLNYEDEIAFPYFHQLVDRQTNKNTLKNKYSAEEYRNHHTDIETKLGDLKNLLLKHIPLKYDRMLRRKLLIGLFELECDLNIHSAIEESILIPLVKKIEKNNVVG